MRKITKWLVALMAASLTMGFASACGGSGDDSSAGGNTGAPETIILNVSSLTLKRGETFSLKAADSDIYAFTFESEDPTIASVTADGSISALKAGTTNILVKCGETVQACPITVTEIVYYTLKLDKKQSDIEVGQVTTLTATLMRSGYDCEDPITWSVTDAEGAIVTYTTNDNVITFTGVALGSVTVTASAQGCAASCTINVVNSVADPDDADRDQTFIDSATLYKDLSKGTTNWAQKKYYTLFEIVETGNLAYSPKLQAMQLAYTKKIYEDGSSVTSKVKLNNELIKQAATEHGYTKVWITVGPANADWDCWLNIPNPNYDANDPNSEENLYKATNDGFLRKPKTISLNLADLYNESTGEYELIMDPKGWWTASNQMLIYDVRFSKDMELNKTEMRVPVSAKEQVVINTVLEEDSVVTYKSADESIAVVDENGYVMGVNPGTTTISVSAPGYYAVCTVKVPDYTLTTDATGVQDDEEGFDDAQAFLTVGSTATFAAAVKVGTADMTDVVAWTITRNDAEIADTMYELTANGNTCDIKITEKGVYTVTAKLYEETYNYVLTVVDGAVEGLNNNDVKLDIFTEDNAALGQFDLTNTMDGTVTYVSMDENVATVDENGKITAVAAGDTKIVVTVTKDGKTYMSDVLVHVYDYQITSAQDKMTVAKNDSFAITAIVTQDGQDYQDVNVVWTAKLADGSDASECVTITVDGNRISVKAEKAGTVIFTATMKDAIYTVEVDIVAGIEELIDGNIETQELPWVSADMMSLYSVMGEQELKFDGTYVISTSLNGKATDGHPTLYVNGMLFAKAVEAGYTHVTLEYESTNCTHVYAHCGNVIVGNGYSKASGSFMIALADLFDGDMYRLSLAGEGEWSVPAVKIKSLNFGTPLKDAIEEGIKSEETNWAAGEYVFAWNTTVGTMGTSANNEVTISHNPGAIVSINEDVLSAAAEQGYQYVTLKMYGNYNFWTIIKNGSDTQLAAAGGKSFNADAPWIVTIALADLLNAETREYQMLMTTGGWWGGCTWTFQALTFSTELPDVGGGSSSDTPVKTPEELLEEGIADVNTNWASTTYKDLWIGTNLSFGDAMVKQSHTTANPTAAMSVDGDLIAAAVEAGYNTVTISVQANYGHWFEVKNPNGGDALYKKSTAHATNEVTTVAIKLADLLNTETGEYQLDMTAAGWWGGCYWQINSLTFSEGGSEGDSSENESSPEDSSPEDSSPEDSSPEEFDKELAEAGLASNANFASMDYLKFWPSDLAHYSDYAHEDENGELTGETTFQLAGKAGGALPLTINSDLLAAAVAAGYTHVSFSFYARTFHLWPSISNGVDEIWNAGANGFQTKYDLTFALSDFLVDGVYTMQLKGANWKTDAALLVYDLSFSNPLEDGLKDANTNWASTTYQSVWSGTNLSFGDAMVKQSHTTANPTAAMSVDGDLIAAAVKAGYNTVTISVQANYGHWFTVTNPNGGDALYKKSTAHATNEVTTVAIKLADLLNTETGEYQLDMTAAGWWGGCYWQINSLTFSTVEEEPVLPPESSEEESSEDVSSEEESSKEESSEE